MKKQRITANLKSPLIPKCHLKSYKKITKNFTKIKNYKLKKMRSNLFNLLGYEFDLPQLINRKNAVSWFEIPVLNVERAVNFYSRVFSVKIREENGMYLFPMNKFADGASGSLVQVKDNKPAKVGTLIYFYTDNLDKSIKLVLANGGKLLKVEDIGKYGKYAHVLDTEGNRIGIHMER